MTRGLLTSLFLWLGLLLAPVAYAQEAARLDVGASSLISEKNGWWWSRPSIDLTLTLSRAVPYRAVIVGDPVRLILDMKNVDLGDHKPTELFGHDSMPDIRWGDFQQNWTRIVIELPGPYQITRSGQQASPPQAVINLGLSPIDEADFEPLPSATAALRKLPEPANLPEPSTEENDKLTVMLDPGHGGFDPGAVVGNDKEADLVLSFAQELKVALEKNDIKVGMTRESDEFVGLEMRMTAARKAGADLFVSLHADALPTGQAAGATVYIWTPLADSRAAEQLARRHDRFDLITGVDLSGKDDLLASVMMDFARTDTQPRSENFASFLTSGMARHGIGLHNRPVQGAAFSVLKSPDIPSVLLELGFITDPVDRANLTSPEWRTRMVAVVVEAIEAWAKDERARKDLLRR